MMMIYLISLLLLIQADFTLSECTEADWSASFNRQGWSVCPDDREFLTGFWRSGKQFRLFQAWGDGLWLLENGDCCPAIDPRYIGQHSTCVDESWSATLDKSHVWAQCSRGYFLEGFHISDAEHLSDITTGRCCRPQNHPLTYDDCYEEDISHSFDHQGWTKCKRLGYYITGIFKGDCDTLSCIEKLKCCRMAKAVAIVNGGWTEFGAWGACSATCGGGKQERSRTCTNPPPSGDGAQCSGVAKEVRACNTDPCEAVSVDGGFSKWSEYSKCSRTCGKGKKTRSRECTNPPPSGNGLPCKGRYSQTVKCKVRPCKGKGK